MASCRGPGSPGVTDALEHLRELDIELRADGLGFPAGASLHLSEISAAIAELEGHQRAAQEGLEAGRTENGKMALLISHTRDAARREVTAEAAAVRASRAAEAGGLQRDLTEVSGLREAAAQRLGDLQRQKERLEEEKEEVEEGLGAMAAALEDQVSVTASLQTSLERRREQTEALTSCRVRAGRDKLRLQRRAELEREAFAARRERVSGEVERLEEEVGQQEEVVRRGRKELDRANERKRETLERLGEVAVQRAALEAGLQRTTASRSRREEQLEAETQRHRRLKEQKELLEKELQESEEASSLLIRRLRGEINAVEVKLEQGRASRGAQRQILDQILQTLERQRGEESRARGELLRVGQRLQESGLRLQRRLASILELREETGAAEEQLEELRTDGEMRRSTLERELRELSRDREELRRTVLRWEEEREQLQELLEAARRRQEEEAARLTSDLRSSDRRYRELLQEEAELQEQQPVSTELLRRHLKQREEQCREEEARRRQGEEPCTADAEMIRSNQEEQRELEEEEETLKELEAAWVEEEGRLKRRKSQEAELKERRSRLEQKLLELEEETRDLLQPRDQLKAELGDVQRRCLDTMEEQSWELRDAEAGVYDCEAKLEQVRTENSRFHLSIRSMEEELSRAREDRDRYREETRLVGRELRDLKDTLQGRWREEASLSRGDDLMTKVTRNRLETRREHLEHLSQRQQQMFRKQGDTAESVWVTP